MNIAREVEKILFPSNVVLVTSLLILAYLGWRLSDVLTFLFSLSAYGVAIYVSKNRVMGENELYASSGLIALLIFLLCSLWLEPSTEVIFGGVSLLLLIDVGYLIRSRWKISGHAAAAVSALTALSLIDPIFLPIGVIVPLVVWSRLKLKAHTPGQVIGGLALGSAIPVLVFLLIPF